jgi:peptidoglycan hydrolase CwlO-like protein
MNKKVIIISVLGLVGVGAFFYFKPKSNAQEQDSLTGGALGNTNLPNTTGVPPTGTVLTTPEQVQETATKIAEARNLASQVSKLRAQRNVYLSSSTKTPTNTFYSSNMQTLINKGQISQLDKKIKELDDKLVLLGFTELNGSIIKIT